MTWLHMEMILAAPLQDHTQSVHHPMARGRLTSFLLNTDVEALHALVIDF